jgi:ABC-type multidrug transport system ATPase subunit
MPLLDARQIGHSYRRFPGRRLISLHGVDLVVEPGECWGLVGPNGSGKSTLLRIAAGLAEPQAGSVTVCGERATSRAAHRHVGFAPESVRWPAALSVADALFELASLRALRGAVARVERVTALTGLRELLSRRLGTLSFGQARRVVLAQALLDDPDLLLLDEPLSGLDSLVILDLREHLRARLAAGAGVVLASHRLEDLSGLCTHVLVLRAGRVVRAGPAAEVLADAGGRAGLAALLGEPAAGAPGAGAGAGAGADAGTGAGARADADAGARR